MVSFFRDSFSANHSCDRRGGSWAVAAGGVGGVGGVDVDMVNGNGQGVLW